jgi:hypothetical protein
VLGDEAIAAGAKGILFPSTIAAPGVNLVLYVDRFYADDAIEVFDPSGGVTQKPGLVAVTRLNKGNCDSLLPQR